MLCIKMSENTDITYYQRNWDVILNKAKDYYKNDKERLRKQEKKKKKKTETYLKKKIKKENMGRTDIIICLKKRSKD